MTAELYARNIAEIGLKGLCFVLAAAVVAEIAFITPWESTANTEPVKTLEEVMPRPAPDGIDANFASILGRPLFSGSRRADVIADLDGEDSPTPFNRRLSGIAFGPGGSEALFESRGEKAIAVRRGGKIDHWTVTRIERDHVVLEGPSGSQTLRLLDSQEAASKVRLQPRRSAPPQAPARPALPRPLPATGARQAAR